MFNLMRDKYIHMSEDSSYQDLCCIVCELNLTFRVIIFTLPTKHRSSDNILIKSHLIELLIYL